MEGKGGGILPVLHKLPSNLQATTRTKRHRFQPWFIGIACILIGGCASHEVAPLTARDAIIGVDKDEVRIFAESAQARRELEKKGLILQDPEITAYLNAVLDRLKPADLPDTLNISVTAVRDSIVNAYAFPNGSIYINIGLLERIANEAQLAHILAHELSHVVLRHSLEAYKDRRDKVVAAHITDLFLFGTSIAYIPYIASISSYSRGQEEEADKMALELMSASGYPLSGATGLFDVLEQVKTGKTASFSIYSSHPDNEVRARYTGRYIEESGLATNAGNPPGTAEYLAVRRRLAVPAITLQLNIKHYELALDSVDRALAGAPDNPWLFYYQGEAWRLMGEDPKGAAREHAWLYDKTYDDQMTAEMAARSHEFQTAALKSYEEALHRDAGLVKANRGIGLVACAQDNRERCRQQLNLYLNSADSIPDRRYIIAVLKKLETGE